MLIHRLLYAMHAFIHVHFIYSCLYLCDLHVFIFHCYQPEVKLSLCNLSYLISSFPSLYPVDVTLLITESINKNANKQGMGFIGSLDQKYTRQFAEEQKDLQELPGWVLPSQTVLSHGTQISAWREHGVACTNWNILAKRKPFGIHSKKELWMVKPQSHMDLD